MADRDLMQIFDAVLPRLEFFQPGCVPRSGAKESRAHRDGVADRRAKLALLGAASGLFGYMTWLAGAMWMPFWVVGAFLAVTGAFAAGTAHQFLRLAFVPRLEQALPPGTDAATAQLEDGTGSLVLWWNHDAFVWNGRVDQLRVEVTDWQRLRDVPEARGIEWTRQGSQTRAEGLVAAMQGLASDRAALTARKEEIVHRLRGLDARLMRLKASEEGQYLALPETTGDGPEDDG